jgi:hypothetical protein
MRWDLVSKDLFASLHQLPVETLQDVKGLLPLTTTGNQPFAMLKKIPSFRLLEQSAMLTVVMKTTADIIKMKNVKCHSYPSPL